MRYNKTIAHTLISCCASAFLMEILMMNAPNSTMLVTFLQFFVIAVQGFIFSAKFGTVKPKVPLTQYTILVTLFFVTSVANNYVYVLHVPSTLHMIIRSASSPASMIVAWYAKRERPKLSKYSGSILITIGVALAMYGGAAVADQNKNNFFYWCIGVTILMSTLFLGAITGLQQEILYAKYDKNVKEMLFYIHALPLPLFLAIYPQLKETAINLDLDLWIIIVLNILSQFYCAHSVHQLASMVPSTTTTFILTLRKFLSLLISSIVFKNNITMLHIVGSIFVVVGTSVYFDFFASRKQKPVSSNESKEQK